MPRLSHTLALTALSREDLARTVSSAYGVLRGARFGEGGLLVLPSEEESRRLEHRARELGLVLTEEERAAHGRRVGDPSDGVGGTGDPAGSTEREVTAQDLADEVAVSESELSLRLLSGEHLAPGSTYLATEVDPQGRPLFAPDGEGWVGTDLTVASWDESGVCAVDFAMREDAGTGGGSTDNGEEGGEAAPSTTGTVVHDHAEETLTLEADLRFPVESAMARWGSRLLRAHVRVRVDLPGWFAAAGGAVTTPPVTLEVDHRLVRARGEAVPAPGPDGTWSVSGQLDVRGVGLSRPIVAVAAWAMGRSLRRSEQWSVESGAARFQEGWDDVAHALPSLPEFLDDVAGTFAGARGDDRPRTPEL
ncbi:hypothetical protein [Nocardiopsis sp. SBT366]|uniref:hypothetical protein n=1 Tax=Nocardiopsis sp. SBT366 TaxID=1580529 RepID=UPI00066C860A|nr:hypothetical protein [Nocardiopsis sp. SBT366]